jgi:hypothetical protein
VHGGEHGGARRDPSFTAFMGTLIVHPFKMSICEIVYLSQTRNFEVKCYLFQDDLREALYNDPLNGALSAEVVTPYIMRQLEIVVDGQKQPLQYQNLRTKDDQVLAQFVTPSLTASGVTKMTVTNRLLIEKFSRQINMVYVYYPTETNKRTKMFDVNKTSEIFNF